MEIENTITALDDFFMFNIWVTLDCNFNCRYCYEQTETRRIYVRNDSADQIVKFIIDMCREKSISVIWLNFHGGEPLLNKNCIVYIIEEIRQCDQIKKMHTSMTTNGSIYDPKMLDYINELSISIDGKQESHDLYRCKKNGDATFEEAYANALKYLKMNPNLRVRMVITPLTVDKLSENILFFIDAGFKIIVPAVDYFDREWEETHFDTLYEQMRIIAEYRTQNRRNDLIIGILDEPFNRMGHCVVGEDGFQIYSDGKIYPCTYSIGKEEYVIGTLHDGLDQKQIQCLNNQLTREVDECTGCNFYHFCTTKRCYFLNDQINGSFYTPSEVICATEHVRIRLGEMNGKKDD